MKKSDIQRMSTSDISKAIELLQAELSVREKKSQALEKLMKTANELGLTMDDLAIEMLGKTQTNKLSGSKVPPKYQHPSDPSLTWTGRGKQPGWIRDLISAGKTLESLAV